MTQFWCERAWTGGSEVHRGVVIDVTDERIASIETGVPAPAAGAEVLRGLVTPGLANAHSHAFQRALRGRTQAAGRGSFWTWREQMYALVTAVDPDSMRALARAAYAEMALAGITVVGEFHYVHHQLDGAAYDDPNAMGEALIEGAREAGIRITLIDACYLHGGIGEKALGAQRRFRDGTADRWAERVGELSEEPHARVGAAIHSIRAVDPENAAVVADWARAHDAPLHAHVSEQPAENEACQAAYGGSPTTVLERAGAVSGHFTAIHATHVSDADVAALGGVGAFCCLCPTTERDLADGVGPASRLRDAGARLALGSDSHAIIEPLEEARAVELDERLVTGERGRHAADDLLFSATAGGYASVGWPEGGMLRAGGLADLVAFDLDSVRLTGLRDPELIDGLVFAGTSADVRDVVVGGRFVVRDRAHTALDVTRELTDAISGFTS